MSDLCRGRSSAVGLSRDESTIRLLWVRVRRSIAPFRSKYLLDHAGERDAGEQSNARICAFRAEISL